MLCVCVKGGRRVCACGVVHDAAIVRGGGGGLIAMGRLYASAIIERGVPSGAVLYLGRGTAEGFGGAIPGGVFGPHDKRCCVALGWGRGGGTGERFAWAKPAVCSSSSVGESYES